ncbi:protein of unknown function [Candidatus Promineifilum breve]|uniref:Uncharacterized protein n=1 Tax=Candidatus Promineifilum breve TaxID=1806508 RepID=A0A160SYG8_9CHLR|nr:hypothetical protein [Candidatus Promineifilum breve]CUS01992.2 protein of unknown function [Candidatus Promineifilum breve]
MRVFTSLVRHSTKATRIWPLIAILVVAFLLTTVASSYSRAEEQPRATTADAPAYGVVFISSAEDRAAGSGRTPASIAQQYQNGLMTGAGWNRWPIYWKDVEEIPGAFNWVAQDATILDDLAHGLQINAILLGTPDPYMTGKRLSRPPRPRPAQLSLNAAERATPQGLFEPIFADGSDTPGAGQTPNPENKWAVFVWLAVNRYKPGGELAQANGWPAGVGVTHWEMWNEPDLDSFWDAPIEDYARLLKVGYLTAKQADPNAVVLFAGLANNFAKINYYRDVLTILAADPQAAEHGFFHDILATHSYFHAWKSWYHVYRALGTMRDFDLDKPIWLNESGVPAWDDYPGPVWDPVSALRATTAEQAAYTIQSALYALYAGADNIFHFQLYDGCGNQPAGTDFPPHNGELCDEKGQYQGKPCAGDANGLFRNPTDMSCFTQHPQPGSARPTLAAFQVLTTHVVDVEPYWRRRPGEAGVCPMQRPDGSIYLTPPQEWIAFYREATGERIVGLWSLCDRDETAIIDATSPDGRATLVYPDGHTQPIAAVDGHYTIELPAATNRNPFPGQSVNPLFPIGGAPVLLIEQDSRTMPELPYRLYLPSVVGYPPAPELKASE